MFGSRLHLDPLRGKLWELIFSSIEPLLLIIDLYTDVTYSINWLFYLLTPLILFHHGMGWFWYSCITWVMFNQVSNVNYLSLVQFGLFHYHLSMSFLLFFKPSTLEMISLLKHFHMIVDPPYIVNTSTPTKKRDGRLHTLCYTIDFDDQCTWITTQNFLINSHCLS